MSSPLFNLLGNNMPTPDFINKFNQFKKMFNGDPKQQVQSMLNSGQMSQQQFNQLSQMATQMQKMLKP